MDQYHLSEKFPKLIKLAKISFNWTLGAEDLMTEDAKPNSRLLCSYLFYNTLRQGDRGAASVCGVGPKILLTIVGLLVFKSPAVKLEGP